MMLYSSFPPPHHVEGCSSIADLIPLGKRCGLYMLHFANGEFYAGQAVDVTRRYVQHRKIHTDIEEISFLQLAKENLNAEERLLIRELERADFRLRNITFTSVPKGPALFDTVMPIEEQEIWLGNPGRIAENFMRAPDLELRRKYSRKFQELCGLPYADQVISFLHNYVHAVIPAFLRSEFSFWTCSCLPSGGGHGTKLYARININWQEVLTVYSFEHSIYVSFHLALSPLEEAFGSSLYDLRAYYPRLAVQKHCYEPGGQDQINLHIQSLRSAQELMEEQDVASAIRLFNLRLMKKGPCNFRRYHCFDLADRLVKTWKVTST